MGSTTRLEINLRGKEHMNVEDRPERSGPLSDLLVVDLTHVLNGPYATMMLADQGARVIKIEPPDGDDARAFAPLGDTNGTYFNSINRGKESIVLNLKDETDRAVFLAMIDRADILTENYRPGTMERLGFSYEVLRERNPRLIYGSSSGFGQTGPLSSFPAYDSIIQAMSGLMTITGWPDGPPTRTGTSLADLLGGLFFYAALSTALHARERTGEGTHVDVAMFDATVAFLEQGLVEYLGTGRTPHRVGNRHPFIAPFDVFETSDGHVTICCGNNHLFELLCGVLGKPEMATDHRFSTNEHREIYERELREELEEVLMTRPTEYWLEVIHDAGVPVGPILNVAEAAHHPQTAARNMIITAGATRMAGTPIKLSTYEDVSVRPAAPSLDEHGPALRAEFAPPAHPDTTR